MLMMPSYLYQGFLMHKDVIKVEEECQYVPEEPSALLQHLSHYEIE